MSRTISRIAGVIISLVFVIALFPGIKIKAASIVDQGVCSADGGSVTWTLDSDGTLTISGTGETSNYSSFDTPFGNKTNIKKVVIESGVTRIGDSLLLGCSNLSEVSIPNSVTSIGDGAFYKCTSLTNITIPNSVTSIGLRTFFGCTSLTNITIPNSVTSIGTDAFRICTSLTSITIPNSVTSIGAGAFCYCTSLTNITIKKSLYDQCKDAFTDISSDKIHFYYDLRYTTDGNGSVMGPSDTFDSSAETLTMSPNKGFTVDKVTWSEGSGDPVELKAENGKYTMPKPSDSFNYGSDTVTIRVFFKKVEYEITFKNYDGTVLEKKKVPEGEIPEYTGTITPEKPSAGGYSYEFAGWDTAPVAVTGPATYTAVYDKKEIEYEITFKNYDGTVLEKKKVPEGEIPEYTGTITPEKPSAGGYSYEFKGWDPVPGAVTGPATYTAVYYNILVIKEAKYTVTFVDNDNVEIYSTTLSIHIAPIYTGKTPVKNETDSETFTFIGWTDGNKTYGLNEDLPRIEKDTIFKPVFKAEPKPVYTVGEVKGDGIKSDIVIDVHRNVDDENCLTYFLSATIDGTEMKINDQYTATKGSTIITIKKDFLSTLPAGEHEVQVVFNDGSISTKVTIAAKASVPSTGEVTGPATYIGLTLIAAASVCGAGVVLLKKRKDA